MTWLRPLVLVATTVLLAACEAVPSTLEPAGPAAARIERLWWVIFWIATVVFVVVIGFLIVAVVRAGRGDVRVDEAVPWGGRFIVIAGVVVPALVLVAVFVLSLVDLAALSRTRDETPLTIDVIGHLWWWEARYPNGAVTANEIHIPAGQRVRLRLTTDDVIHSFWVPRLQGKVDQIPGRVNTMWLEADEPGRYRGQCAEFCGLQHANMAFYVVADPPEEFDAWVEREAEPADAPAGEAALGEDVFLETTCVGCHTVRGTPADAELGPDLTHVASRDTLFAGTIANTRANLAELITHPEEIKPGVTMPPTELTDAQLDALVRFLEELD